MADLTIRNIPDSLYRAIDEYASRNNHTPEEEVLDLIASHFPTAKSGKGLVEALIEFGRIAQFTDEELALF